MDDWAVAPYGFAERIPWIVLEDGTVVLGDKGQLHDDLLDQYERTSYDVLAMGEIVNGHAVQLRPMGDEYTEAAQETYDEAHFRHVAAEDDWAPQFKVPADEYKFIRHRPTGQVNFWPVRNGRPFHDQMIQSFYAPGEDWRWGDWSTGFATVWPGKAPQMVIYERDGDPELERYAWSMLRNRYPDLDWSGQNTPQEGLSQATGAVLSPEFGNDDLADLPAHLGGKRAAADFTIPEGYDRTHEDNWGWSNRTPYVYLPDRDYLLWGHAGQWHTPMNDYLLEQGIDTKTEPSVFGSVYTNPDDPSQRFQEVHRFSWPNAYADYYTYEMKPEHYDLLARRIGVPFGNLGKPELMDGDLEDIWKPKLAAPEDWGPMRINMLEEPYEFKMPLDVERNFAARFECPSCGGHLRQSEQGVYCEHCGWQPRMAALAPNALPYASTQTARLMRKYLERGTPWFYVAQYAKQFVTTNWPNVSPTQVDAIMRAAAQIAEAPHEPSIEGEGRKVTIPQSDQFGWGGEMGNDPRWSKRAHDDWAPAFIGSDVYPEDYDYYKQRRPWLWQHESPQAHIGQLGDFHPHPAPENAWLGEIWEDTSPPTFKVIAPPRTLSYDLADGEYEQAKQRALAEAQRAYFQQQDKPEQRTSADLVPGNEGHWVWLDGQVGFGGEHHEIARTLAQRLGYDPTAVNFISNTIARNGMPEGHAIAVGAMRGRYPQIYNSTRDRNAVWDDVMRAHEGFAKTAGLIDDAQRAYASLVSTGGFSLTQSLDAASGQAYFAAYEQPTRLVSLSDFGPEDIVQWRHDVLPILQSDQNNLIGGWLNEGTVYLDVSRAFQDEYEALEFARANRQQAIWDGFNNVEIYVNADESEIREARLRKLGMSVQWAAPIFSENLAAPIETTTKIAAMPWKFDLMRAVNQASYLIWHMYHGGTREQHQKMLQDYPEFTNPNYEEWEAEKFKNDVPHGGPEQWRNRYPEWEDAQAPINMDDPNAITPTDVAQNKLMDLQFQEQPKTLVDRARGLTDALKSMPPINMEGDMQRSIYNAFLEIYNGLPDRAYDELFRTGLNEAEIQYVLNEINTIIEGWKGRGALSWLSKESMAERTGDPRLDSLIEDYLKRGTFEWWSADGFAPDGTFMGDTWTRDELRQNTAEQAGIPIEELRGGDLHQLPDPDYAHGNCGDLARDFARFLVEHGVQAECDGGDVQRLYNDIDEDRSVSDPDGGHAVTLVKMPSGTYTVDWTASQYGYTEFPMVQKLDQSGQWQRKF